MKSRPEVEHTAADLLGMSEGGEIEMTLPAEADSALAGTRALLLALVEAEDVPGWVRREAARLLKHYPLTGDLTQALERLRVLAASRTS